MQILYFASTVYLTDSILVWAFRKCFATTEGYHASFERMYFCDGVFRGTIMVSMATFLVYMPKHDGLNQLEPNKSLFTNSSAVLFSFPGQRVFLDRCSQESCLERASEHTRVNVQRMNWRWFVQVVQRGRMSLSPRTRSLQ